jgi:hypothetical protein
MTNDPAREILVREASALAHGDDLRASLDSLLALLLEQLEIDSAVIVVRPAGSADGLVIIASAGLPEAAIAGLTGAMANPDHTIPRTFDDPGPSFDVPPSQPGGPALRSHLPLRVTRSGTTSTPGVLALAYERPLAAEDRRSVEAVADLAAVALEDRPPD